jgi:hypothetical protein
MVRARQRRVLRAMENELAACEPPLVAMFAFFGRLTRDEEPAGKEGLPGRRWSFGLLLSVPLVGMAVLIGVLAVLPARAYSACGAAGHTKGARGAVAVAVSCPVSAPRRPGRAAADNPVTAAEPVPFTGKLAASAHAAGGALPACRVLTRRREDTRRGSGRPGSVGRSR